nr:ser-7 [Meloidogyne graminicola]
MSIKEFENFKESSLILNNLGSFVHAQIVEIDNNINNSFLLNEKSILPQSNSLFYSHPIFAIFISILIFILIVITILGNLGVCAAILLVRKLKAQPANLLLISLALADFCVGLFVMPLAAIYVLEDRWIFGEILCRFWVTADLTLCTASILNLCAISVDRHLAVTRALRYSALRTRRRICLYICIVWLGALLVSAAPLALLPFPKIEKHCQVSQNRFYQIYATIISFWCPSLIMVIVYVKLWSAAKRMHRQDQLVLRWQGVHLPSDGDLEGLPPQTNKSLFRSDSVVARANARFLFALRMSAQKLGYYDQNNNKNETNTISDGRMSNDETLRIEVRTSASSSGGGGGGSTLGTLRVPLVLIIMSAFIICWVPFFILVLAKSQHWVEYVPRWLDSLALWLGYSNSMLNPIIYCKYNREFRLPFGEMICCRFRTIQDVMRNESYYAKFGSPRISEGGQRLSNSKVNNYYSKRKRNNTERRVPQKGESLLLNSSSKTKNFKEIKRNSSPSILMESNRKI